MDNVQVFQGASMPEALEAVKRELGTDAVILGTRAITRGGLGRLVGKGAVEITAAPAGDMAPAPRITATPATQRPAAAQRFEMPRPRPWVPPDASHDALAEQLEPHYVRLVQNEVGADLARRLVRQAADRARADRLSDKAALEDVVRKFVEQSVPTAGGIQLVPGKTRRIALVGPPGSGKTTTLAKLAAEFSLRRRKQVAMLSLDLHRLAAHEQLQRYGQFIGVPVHAAQTPTDADAKLKEISNPDLVLIDTPGVGLREPSRLAELTAMLRAVRPDEVHLVVSTSLDSRIIQRMGDAFKPLGVSRVLLTHLDEAVGWGVVLNATRRLPWHVSYVADGQKVPNDISEACSRELAALVLPQTGA